ncbi:MAG: TonB-dependent receptor [Thalassobius sp.]|nr:TonB-dependent receptor [Thalassovita sp.]
MKNIFTFLLVLVSLATYSQSDDIVITNEPTDTIFLKETTIQAYRAYESTPVTFKNISKKEIDLLNTGQEPSIILSYTPSINSYSDAGNYQGYSYFRLRGIDQTRVNMTLDGIPLNEPEDQGAYFSNYPDFFNSINSIQIQRGVGTSTNGVASYAGSINFQSPNFLAKQSMAVGANYGSFNTYRLFAEYNSGLQKDKAIYTRVSHLNSDGYKYHSGNESNSAFVSAGLFKEKHQLKFTGFIGNQKNELAWIGVPLETINKEPRTNADSDEHDSFLQGLMSLQHSWTLDKNIVLNNTVYYNFLDGNYDFDLNNFLGFPSTEEMYNYDFRHNFIGYFSNINWYLDNLKIDAGIHLNTFNRRHIGSERSLGKLYENTGYKNEFSTFVKARYSINNFVLFGDVQYRHTNFDYEGSVDFEQISWNFINPKVGVSYFLDEETSIYASFGTSGREPTRNDLFNGEDDLLANEDGSAAFTNVEPEEVQNYEAGLKLMHDRWHLLANVYYMNFKNEIVLNGQYGPNGLPLHSNVAKSFRSGVELDFKVKILEDFYYTNTSSYSYNRIQENEIEFSPILTPTVIVNQSIGFQKNALQAGMFFKYQNESYIDFENSYQTPSYFTIDIFGSYTYKSLDFRVGVNNLTNRTIISNGYIGLDGTPLYFVQAPINFTTGITWKI